MKHPNQATLALHAGGDLGRIASWKTERHLSSCELCRREVDAFNGLRDILPGLAETPEIPWHRLAADMKANIRLGLAAGECVPERPTPLRESSWFTGGRAVVACASVLLLLITGIVLERPSPVSLPDEGPVAQAMTDGIQVRAGGQAFGLMNVGASQVSYSASAQGSMRASYEDPVTGLVTVNEVHAQ